jgi:hypothetical protein
MQQQSTRHVAAVRARSVEHFMVAAETGFIRQSHDAQDLGHGTLAGCQHGATDQSQDMAPDRSGEARSETASQDTRIVGAVGWAVAGSMRFCVIESVELSRAYRARVPR